MPMTKAEALAAIDWYGPTSQANPGSIKIVAQVLRALVNAEFLGDLTTAELSVLGGVTPGTGLVSKALVLDSSGNLIMPATGSFALSRVSLAALGSTQAGAAVITTQLVAVTASDGAKGVALPAASATLGAVLIINTVTTVGSYLKIYPVNSGDDQINGLSANAAYLLAPGDGIWLVPVSATQWWTLDAGIAAVPGQSAFAALCHTGGIPAQVSTDGNDTTPVATETYVCGVQVPASMTVTGVRLFNGSAVAGNVKAGLFDSTGVNVAATASTAQAGIDAYQQVAFSAPYSAKGPATYFIGAQFDTGVTPRFNSHAFGAFPAFKKTGETYGTFTTLTPVATFAANLGPIATLY